MGTILRKPWLLDYLLGVAREFGGEPAPLSEKKRLVQIVKVSLLTQDARTKPTLFSSSQVQLSEILILLKYGQRYLMVLILYLLGSLAQQSLDTYSEHVSYLVKSFANSVFAQRSWRTYLGM